MNAPAHFFGLLSAIADGITRPGPAFYARICGISSRHILNILSGKAHLTDSVRRKARENLAEHIKNCEAVLSQL